MTDGPGPSEPAAGLDSAGVAGIVHATSALIREVRLARGVVMTHAADECSVSPSVLSRAELARREPRLSLLLTLCGVLGVRLSAVLRMAEDEAFRLGTAPWTIDPAELLGHASDGYAAFLDAGPDPAGQGDRRSVGVGGGEA